MRYGILCLTAILALTGSAVADDPAANPVAELKVFPPDVQLRTSRTRQSLVVQATYANGITRDVTAEAKFALADGKLCRFEDHTLHPTADGETQLTVEFAGQKVTVPVKVEQATADRPVSFKLDVMPVFMKAGCNTGSCHGAARGKDGFRLSLFRSGR